MYLVDCRGKTCPLPVLETKRAIEENSLEALRVAVDNETSRENVRRFLESRGYRVLVEGEGEATFLTATKETEETVRTTAPKRVLVFIDGETLGRGNDQLGAILMKAFVLVLKELKPLPWRLVFINSGVKIASEGSELLPYVRELENMGVEILSCGTCLDFYNLKEKLGVGRVSNMFEIVSSLTEAASVLKP